MAVSDGREIESGKATSSVGTTVNLEYATYTNTIGDAQLIAFWQDPEFDSNIPAFYYARVIEIPTPRWTAYDAKRYNITVSKDVQMVLQERAWLLNRANAPIFSSS